MIFYWILKLQAFLNPHLLPGPNTESSSWSEYQLSQLPLAAYVTFWPVKLILAIRLPVALMCWSSLLTTDGNTSPSGFWFISLPADLLNPDLWSPARTVSSEARDQPSVIYPRSMYDVNLISDRDMMGRTHKCTCTSSCTWFLALGYRTSARQKDPAGLLGNSWRSICMTLDSWS